MPGLGTAAQRAFGRFMDTMTRLRERAEDGVPVGDLLEAILRETGYLDALEAERTIEAQGRMENLEELVEVGARVRRPRRGGRRHARRVPAAGLARRRRRHAPRRRGPRDADDAPQREGPRVPDRLHDRLRGGRLPALALARRGHARGGAAPLLRRHDARDARPLPHLRAPPRGLRRGELRAPEPLPRRDPARPHRVRRRARRVRRRRRLRRRARRRRGVAHPVVGRLADRGARAPSTAWATTSSTRPSARAS